MFPIEAAWEATYAHPAAANTKSARPGTRFSRLRHRSKTEGAKALVLCSMLLFYAAQENGAECPFFPSWENSSPNALTLEVVA
jgi:hypothetical protein